MIHELVNPYKNLDHTHCIHCDDEIYDGDSAYNHYGEYICESCIDYYLDELFEENEARDFIRKWHLKSFKDYYDGLNLEDATRIDLYEFIDSKDLFTEFYGIDYMTFYSDDEE